MTASQAYFDYCATTPVHPDVLKAMLPALQDEFGNPSSMHRWGQQARRVVEEARGRAAACIGAEPDEVIFTSGATEADNLALLGIAGVRGSAVPCHIITSSIEHHAVLHTAQALEAQGCAVTYLPVNSAGLLNPGDVRAALRPETVLVSIMMVNNETGSVQPVAELAAAAHAGGALFHTDAVQAVGLMDVDVRRLGIDLMSLSAHKIYGPKGVGLLYVRQGLALRPQTYGGPQERKMRAGTENVPAILGMAAALEWVCAHRTEERRRMVALRRQLVAGIKSRLPDVVINGSEATTSPHVISISIPGVSGEMLLFRLNQQGIAVSMGSACTSEDILPSHVLQAMGLSPQVIDGTLRISLGHFTTEEDMALLLNVLPDAVKSSGYTGTRAWIGG